MSATHMMKHLAQIQVWRTGSRLKDQALPPASCRLSAAAETTSFWPIHWRRTRPAAEGRSDDPNRTPESPGPPVGRQHIINRKQIHPPHSKKLKCLFWDVVPWPLQQSSRPRCVRPALWSSRWPRQPGPPPGTRNYSRRCSWPTRGRRRPALTPDSARHTALPSWRLLLSSPCWGWTVRSAGQRPADDEYIVGPPPGTGLRCFFMTTHWYHREASQWSDGF